jgi:hypothetical protein
MNITKPKKPGNHGEEGVFDVLANRALTVRLLVFTTVLFMAVSVIGPLLTVYICHEPQLVAIVNYTGSVTITPLQRFKDALAFHKIAANQATLAMLNRNPDGLDDTDLIDLMFNPKAHDKLTQLLQDQQPNFTEYSYHQKAEIQTTEIAADPDGSLRARVKGQLIRVGVFNDAAKLDRVSFTLILYLFRNNDAATNQKYPLGIWNFDYSEVR